MPLPDELSDAKSTWVIRNLENRNKAHSLPYFLGGIENQSYPKNRIKIWFVTDHNEDDSLELLKHWKDAWEVKVKIFISFSYYFSQCMLT